MISSRDRVRMAVAHEEPDHVPCDDDLFEDCRRQFVAEGMPADVSAADTFGYDFEHLALDASPRLPQRLIEETETQITFVHKAGYSATKWKNKSGALHYFDHVTRTHADWDRVRQRLVPDVDGSARISRTSYFTPFVAYPDWDGAVAEYQELRDTGRYVLIGFYGPLEATWRHHGYVETMMDLAQDPDWVAEMMHTYTDLVCDTIRSGWQRGIRPDGLFLIEDLGTTQGTLMSPECFRRVILPCHAAVFTIGRELGMSRFMHSDGRIHAILDDLIEAGMEVLNPIDTGSGMDLVALKRRYGQNLALFGGVSARDMHDPQRSNAQIDRGVPVAAKGGGYIYHSDHSVPPGLTLARYRDILDRVRRCTTPAALARVTIAPP